MNKKGGGQRESKKKISRGANDSQLDVNKNETKRWVNICRSIIAERFNLINAWLSANVKWSITQTSVSHSIGPFYSKSITSFLFSMISPSFDLI